MKNKSVLISLLLLVNVLTFVSLASAIAPTPPIPTQTQSCGSTFLDLGTAPTYCTYYWQTSTTGTSTTVATGNRTVTVGGTYYVRTYNGYDQTWSTARTVSVVVKAIPQPPLVANVERCGSGTVTFVPSSIPAGATVKWYEQGTIKSSNETFITPVLTDTKTYTVKSDLNSCLSATSTTVQGIVLSLPAANAGLDKAICVNDTVTLSGSGNGTGGIQSYSWSYYYHPDFTSIQNPTLSPASTTIYTLKVTDAKQCTNTDEVTITVKTRPAPPTVANEARCGDGTVTFTPSWVPTNATVKWYEGASLQSSNEIFTTPVITSSKTYTAKSYLNECLSATATTVQATRNPLPVAPTSVTATLSTICYGSSTTLSYSGGSGTVFKWYSGSCEGSYVGTGNSISVSPTATTTYYGRWETATCGSSTCATVKVTVNPLPVAPTSVTATATAICAGDATTLTYTGGSGTTFKWYKGSCEGSYVGTGNSISVSPPTTTTYYGRWETATCGNSTCVTVTITVKTLPEPPTVANEARCGDGTVTFTPSWVPTNATVKWYEGASLQSSNEVFTTPVITSSKTYTAKSYLNECLSATATTVQATRNPLPVAPTSVTATLSTICYGSSITLSYSGGSGTIFKWYSGSCGGSYVGTGNSISVSPTATTTYYGRWETTTCGNSACATVTVTVNTPPVAPTSVAAALSTICYGSSTTLSYSGGSGKVFKWYSGSCGGSSVGTGNSISVAPTATTTYYGRWESSPCTPSACKTVTVTVNATPVAPTSVSSAQSAICSGSSTTLSYSGGSGLIFKWYSGSCGGPSVGTGNSISVAPTVTTTYYGRWESSPCTPSACKTVTVTVNTPPVAPTSVAAALSTICYGSSTTLSYSGGSGLVFKWYSGSCGGSSVGTGNSISVAPTATTTYYGRWESSPCTPSACKTVTVTVNTAPVTPTSVSSAESAICFGSSTTLSYSGGSGLVFKWYSGSCGGTSVGTGNSISVAPTVTTTYYGRWESSPCTPSACKTVTVTVNPVPNIHSISPAKTHACGNELIGFTATGTAKTGTTFNWLVNNTSGQTGESVSYTMPSDGTHNISLTASIGACKASAVPLAFTRYKIPNNPGVQDVTQYDPGVANLTATKEAGTTLQWLNASGTAILFNGEPFTPTINVNTTYSVKAVTQYCQSPTLPINVTIVFPNGRVLYARASGNWNDPATWSNIQGGSPLTIIPNNATQVFIDGYEVTVNAIAESGPIELKDNSGTLSKLNVLTAKELKVFGPIKMNKTSTQNLVKINVEEEGKLSCVEP